MAYGYFAEGKRLRYYEEERMGVSLLRAEIPNGKKHNVSIRKAVKFFRRAGVRQLLNGPDFLEREGLMMVETGPLYRERAAEIAFRVMEQRGLSAAGTVVGIRGNRWTREMEQACQQLAGRVRTLAVALPDGLQEEVVWTLQRQYGLSVLSGDGDLTLCFSPAESGPGRVLLGEKRPVVAGVSLCPSLEGLPEEAAEGLFALFCHR